MRKKQKQFRRKAMEMLMMEAGHEIFRNPTSPSPTWKLYDNPFYYSHPPHLQYHHNHHLHFPLSARKLAATFWDLPLFSSSTDVEGRSAVLLHRRVSMVQSELDLARARNEDLKAEVEFERRLRKKAESVNKRLAKELAEERKGREVMGKVCEELAIEIAADKAEIERMKKEMEEERRMLRIAEVWREERVQMKLVEVKLLMEEKLKEFSKERDFQLLMSKVEEKREDMAGIPQMGMGSCANNNHVRTASHRKESPEPENPHIKRGIKGFVEFPRVVRAVGSRGRQSGAKLECQKAQLRLLLRQKSPAGLGVAGTETRLIVG